MSGKVKSYIPSRLYRTGSKRQGRICEIYVRFNETGGNMGKGKQAMTQVKIHVKESKTYYPIFEVTEQRLLLFQDIKYI